MNIFDILPHTIRTDIYSCSHPVTLVYLKAHTGYHDLDQTSWEIRDFMQKHYWGEIGRLREKMGWIIKDRFLDGLYSWKSKKPSNKTLGLVLELEMYSWGKIEHTYNGIFLFLELLERYCSEEQKPMNQSIKQYMLIDPFKYLFAALGRYDVLLCLKKNGFPLNISDERGKTIIYHAIVNLSKYSFITVYNCTALLLGSDCWFVDRYMQQTALQYYVGRESVDKDLIKTLINNSPLHILNMQDDEGNTALYNYTINHNNRDIVRSMILANCDPLIENKDGENILSSVISNDSTAHYIDEVIGYMERKKIDITRNVLMNRYDIMWCAIYRRGPETVLRLIGMKCSVDGRSDNVPYLIHAVRKDKIDIVRLLLKKNCDPNHQDNLGNTALHTALSNYKKNNNSSIFVNSLHIAKLLIVNNADIMIKNNADISAIDILKDDNNKKILSELWKTSEILTI